VAQHGSGGAARALVATAHITGFLATAAAENLRSPGDAREAAAAPGEGGGPAEPQQRPRPRQQPPPAAAARSVGSGPVF
jgi:hypothetical protein